ncbi:MAG TPA: hypothetical protein VGO34_15010 [Alphaproteobacteria bacterium]|jgi:hypothetical protein
MNEGIELAVLEICRLSVEALGADYKGLSCIADHGSRQEDETDEKLAA